MKKGIVLFTFVAFLFGLGFCIKDVKADSKKSPLSGLMLADKKEKKEVESKEEALKSKEELLKKWEESLKKKEEELKAWEARLNKRAAQRRAAPGGPGAPQGLASPQAPGAPGSPGQPGTPPGTVPQTGTPVRK
jgi:hypothetical protein